MAFAAGQVLTAAQLESETNNKPLSVNFNSGVQSVPSVTVFSMPADSEIIDWSNAAMHSTTVNPNRITCQQDGLYLVQATLLFATNGTGRRAMEFWKNAATQYKAAEQPAHSGGEAILNASRYIELAVGDYIQVRAYQDSGGALNVTLLEFAALYVRD
jgi:hypothetical protein